ncbi:MAG TPA: hypothetical protein VLA36_04120 [Longimicrobiales bacterium]|nr:hypothetical protein [Longimicrobiales bacterium]
MAKELFTHRGSGTLVRRDEEIRASDAWDHVDAQRLRALIESSFGRRLTPDYFETVRPARVYVSEHYRAAIVLVQEGGLVYMDKFAVSEDAQGEGLGRAMWEVMRDENPRLFWRSRRGNAINEFYFANATGARKDGDWTVFWCGLTDWDDIHSAVEHALGRPATQGETRPAGPSPGATALALRGLLSWPRKDGSASRFSKPRPGHLRSVT